MAGTDRHSACFEQHQKVEDILCGRKVDPTFYPVIYGATDDADWTSEEVWYRANPSLGHTIDIGKVRNACLSARDNPSEENISRQLRLNRWVKQSTRWMQMEKWDVCAFQVDEGELLGRECYGGLDLSSSIDITAFVLVFPSRNDSQRYVFLPFFWIPEENMVRRVRRDHVPYDVWERQGGLETTEGNIKPDKEKSTKKIDGAVVAIMALDRAVRNGGSTGSAYDVCVDFVLLMLTVFWYTGWHKFGLGEREWNRARYCVYRGNGNRENDSVSYRCGKVRAEEVGAYVYG